MNKLALLPLLGAALFGFRAAAAAPPSPAPAIVLHAVDNYNYTWDLVVVPSTGAVSGTWDTSYVGCPVYAVVGSFTGSNFTLQVSQSVSTICDVTGTFVGTFDRATFTAAGTYVGSGSGGPFAWSWMFF